MIKKLAISCGVLTLLLYGQTQSERTSQERNSCISVGSSGALFCQDGTLDIVTAVVPRLMHKNSFTGLNTFALGVTIDTREDQKRECQEGLRGTFWFRKYEPASDKQKDERKKDSMQVCVREFVDENGREVAKYKWEGVELHAEQ